MKHITHHSGMRADRKALRKQPQRNHEYSHKYIYMSRIRCISELTTTFSRIGCRFYVCHDTPCSRRIGPSSTHESAYYIIILVVLGIWCAERWMCCCARPQLYHEIIKKYTHNIRQSVIHQAWKERISMKNGSNNNVLFGACVFVGALFCCSIGDRLLCAIDCPIRIASNAF